MKPHRWDCDCVSCENLRADGLPTDGRCSECDAPYDTEHRDGCTSQFREDRVGTPHEERRNAGPLLSSGDAAICGRCRCEIGRRDGDCPDPCSCHLLMDTGSNPSGGDAR